MGEDSPFFEMTFPSGQTKDPEGSWVFCCRLLSLLLLGRLLVRLTGGSGFFEEGVSWFVVVVPFPRSD